jgi:hypothetical protein
MERATNGRRHLGNQQPGTEWPFRTGGPISDRDQFAEPEEKPLAAQPDTSAGTVFRSVWNGAFDVFVRLRFPSLLGLLIYLVAGFLGYVAPAIADNPVLREGLDAIKTILLLPLQIAIYRLLILGEASSGYDFAIFAPRFQRLLGWTLVLWALISLPSYLAGLITTSDDADATVTAADVVLLVATIATMAIAIVLLVRLVVLFPAIAVDAAGTSVRNALADTKGRSWLIVKSYLMVLLPLLAGLVAVGLIGDFDDPPAWWSAAKTAFDSSLEFLVTVLATVIASRLFDWIGHQVKGVTV